MNKKVIRKNKEVFDAWLNDDNAVIQARINGTTFWVTVTDPAWCKNTEYRIKPEFVEGNVEDLEVAYRPMSTAGTDHDGRARTDVKQTLIQLDLSLTFENIVELSHPLVIMRARLGANLDNVHTGNATRFGLKSAPGTSAWTWHRWCVREIDKRIAIVVYELRIYGGRLRHDLL